MPAGRPLIEDLLEQRKVVHEKCVLYIEEGRFSMVNTLRVDEGKIDDLIGKLLDHNANK